MARSPRDKAVLLIRDAIYTSMYFTGAAQVYRWAMGRKRGTISFHNVLPRLEGKLGDVYNFDLTREVFEQQIRYLAQNFEILPAHLFHQPPEQGYFITVDDGMLNSYEIIMPVLDRYGITAIFAVCPGLVEGDIHHLWRDHIYLLLRESLGKTILLPTDDYQSKIAVTWDNLNQLGATIKNWAVRRGRSDIYGLIREVCERNGLPYRRYQEDVLRFHPVDWEMIREMESRGHVIASHTWSHRNLSLLPPEERALELGKSKEILEERLGMPVDVIVYPYGDPSAVDCDCMRLAQECGYKKGLMNVNFQVPGPIGMNLSRFSLPRSRFTPHLYAAVSGFKFALRRPRRVRSSGRLDQNDVHPTEYSLRSRF